MQEVDHKPNAATVLVADDESHILNVVSMKLRRGGYEVVTASDGAEALELARGPSRPALVLTDFNMPRMNGLELCRALAATDGWSAPAVLLTAQDGGLDAEELRAAGVVEVVNKPFSPRALLAVADRLLGRDRATA